MTSSASSKAEMHVHVPGCGGARWLTAWQSLMAASAAAQQTAGLLGAGLTCQLTPKYMTLSVPAIRVPCTLLCNISIGHAGSQQSFWQLTSMQEQRFPNAGSPRLPRPDPR